MQEEKVGSFQGESPSSNFKAKVLLARLPHLPASPKPSSNSDTQRSQFDSVLSEGSNRNL